MFANLRLSLAVLRRRPFFTFVSLFGIAFTLTTLLVVTSLLDGVLAPRAPEVHQDRSLYLNGVNLWSDNNDFFGGPGYALLDAYFRDLPGVEITTFFTRPTDEIDFVAGERVETGLRRTDAEYWRAFAFDFLTGGPFDDADVDAARAVIVIDESTQRAFFGDESAYGRTLTLGDRTYDVIGVVRDVNALRNASTANAWAPITTHSDPEWRERRRGDFAACFVAYSTADFAAIREEVDLRLAAWQPLPEDRFENAAAYPVTRLDEIVHETSGGPSRERPDVSRFWLLVAVAVLLFMLLPAVNLINVNMSRILERASEIGVRKAFGASNGALLQQFLFESVVLCLIGGALSFLLAGFLTTLVSQAGWIEGVSLRLSLRVFFVGLGLTLVFGVLSGIVPAWRMARLHPIQALRGGER